MEIKLSGVEAYRVYQRNEQDQSDIPFGLELSGPLTGEVEARLYSAERSAQWQRIGTVERSPFYGTLKNIPTGTYGIEFRVSGGEHTASASVYPVFVGDLWILAGQSNMEGCGKELEVEPPEEGVSCFDMGDHWVLAEDPLCWLQEAVDPVHWRVPEEHLAEEAKRQRRERANGAGLGITFAKELLRETGIPIGLIMAAHGGSSMEQWDPKQLNEGGHSLYGSMMRKIQAVGGQVKGCLWYQGESDANEQAGPLYMQRMLDFIGNLRKDTGQKEIPFIYAQLSVHYSDEDPTWWNYIQQAQLGLEMMLDGIYMVPTIDASLSDSIHLDAKSLQAVGRRMAWTVLRQVYGQSAVETGPRFYGLDWNTERTELRISLKGINGRLVSVRQVFGFQVEAADSIQEHYGRITDDGYGVLLAFDRPVPLQATLKHGAGMNPMVNVQDRLGIPLPVFGPVSI